MISFHSCNRRCAPRKWNLSFKWITVYILTAWSTHGQRPFKGRNTTELFWNHCIWIFPFPLMILEHFYLLQFFFCYNYSLLAFVSSAWSHIFVFIFIIRTFIKLHFCFGNAVLFVVWQMTNSLFIVLLSLCVECFGKEGRYYDCSHLGPSFY